MKVIEDALLVTAARYQARWPGVLHAACKVPWLRATAPEKVTPWTWTVPVPRPCPFFSSWLFQQCVGRNWMLHTSRNHRERLGNKLIPDEMLQKNCKDGSLKTYGEIPQNKSELTSRSNQERLGEIWVVSALRLAPLRVHISGTGQGLQAHVSWLCGVTVKLYPSPLADPSWAL